MIYVANTIIDGGETETPMLLKQIGVGILKSTQICIRYFGLCMTDVKDRAQFITKIMVGGE